MQLVAIAIAAAMLWLGYLAATAWTVRYRALRRLYESVDQEPADVIEERSVPRRWLARWLIVAGYRRPNAPTLFIVLTFASAMAGIAAGALYRTAFETSLVEMVSNVPGGVGEFLVALLQSGPWFLFFLGASLPSLTVRAARRARVQAIERDLPLVLELFATMGEAGLGFDAALSKIVRAQESDRPLIAEFVGFQLDMLAGVPRLQALRQLARRVDVTSITTFTSALIQAEQVGASIAETLRHQADDLRERRREDALLQAQALPVKLVFPLVICFLPGIFVSTLAPVIYQMIEVAGGVLRAGR